mgnify:CR=1 FL=1
MDLFYLFILRCSFLYHFAYFLDILVFIGNIMVTTINLCQSYPLFIYYLLIICFILIFILFLFYHYYYL